MISDRLEIRDETNVCIESEYVPEVSEMASWSTERPCRTTGVTKKHAHVISKPVCELENTACAWKFHQAQTAPTNTNTHTHTHTHRHRHTYTTCTASLTLGLWFSALQDGRGSIVLPVVHMRVLGEGGITSSLVMAGQLISCQSQLSAL